MTVQDQILSHLPRISSAPAPASKLLGLRLIFSSNSADSAMADQVASDTLPSAETQVQIKDYTILDRQGKELPFRDIIKTDRTVVIFVRHFFCGVRFQSLDYLC